MRTMRWCLAAALMTCGLSSDGLRSGARAEEPIATVKYACEGGKSISATYYKDRVELALSDGRSMTLPTR